MHIQMSKHDALVKHYYHKLDTIGYVRPGEGALFLIFFSLFSNKQDTGTEQINDEYVETLRDISGA